MWVFAAQRFLSCGREGKGRKRESKMCRASWRPGTRGVGGQAWGGERILRGPREQVWVQLRSRGFVGGEAPWHKVGACCTLLSCGREGKGRKRESKMC